MVILSFWVYLILWIFLEFILFDLPVLMFPDLSIVKRAAVLLLLIEPTKQTKILRQL